MNKASRLFRALGIFALALGVLTIALFIVQYSRGNTANSAASQLLIAYEEKPTPSPSPVMTTAPTPTPETSPEVSIEPFATPAGEVDESADYEQPDAPDAHGEVEALIARIVASEGDDGVIGIIEIPEIKIELPIIGKWSYPLLKVSICRYGGPLPNHKGHLVLLGHNYKSGAHFGNLSKLKKGSEIFLTDTATNTRLRYEVYEIKTIEPDDFDALKTFKGEKGLTLLTCVNSGNDRHIFRCVQKDATSTPTSKPTTKP